MQLHALAHEASGLRPFITVPGAGPSLTQLQQQLRTAPEAPPPLAVPGFLTPLEALAVPPLRPALPAPGALPPPPPPPTQETLAPAQEGPPGPLGTQQAQALEEEVGAALDLFANAVEQQGAAVAGLETAVQHMHDAQQQQETIPLTVEEVDAPLAALHAHADQQSQDADSQHEAQQTHEELAGQQPAQQPATPQGAAVVMQDAGSSEQNTPTHMGSPPALGEETTDAPSLDPEAGQTKLD